MKLFLKHKEKLNTDTGYVDFGKQQTVQTEELKSKKPFVKKKSKVLCKSTLDYDSLLKSMSLNCSSTSYVVKILTSLEEDKNNETSITLCQCAKEAL